LPGENRAAGDSTPSVIAVSAAEVIVVFPRQDALGIQIRDPVSARPMNFMIRINNAVDTGVCR
jgi:hypothetical protein